MTIKPNNSKSVSIKIQSELLEGLSAVPPSSQTFKIFRISSAKFPCLIETQEVDNNVIIPTTIVHSPQAWIKVFNANEEIRLINTNKLIASPIENFDIFKCEKSTTNNVNEREKLLKRALHDKIPNQAKTILWPLCKEFSDIFYLEGDKATVNNFYSAQLRMNDYKPVLIYSQLSHPASTTR